MVHIDMKEGDHPSIEDMLDSAKRQKYYCEECKSYHYTDSKIGKEHSSKEFWLKKGYDLRTKAGMKHYNEARGKPPVGAVGFYGGTWWFRKSAMERQKRIDKFNKETNYRWAGEL